MGEKGGLKRSLSAALLSVETIDNSKYEEYRMNLELALNRAESYEKIAFHTCWASLLVAVVLSFFGGSQAVGSFDPYDEKANPLSITLGIIYVFASIAFPLSLASLYSRFRPTIRSLKQEMSDAKIDKLQREVEELRAQLGKRAE